MSHWKESISQLLLKIANLATVTPLEENSTTFFSFSRSNNNKNSDGLNNIYNHFSLFLSYFCWKSKRSPKWNCFKYYSVTLDVSSLLLLHLTKKEPSLLLLMIWVTRSPLTKWLVTLCFVFINIFNYSALYTLLLSDWLSCCSNSNLFSMGISSAGMKTESLHDSPTFLTRYVTSSEVTFLSSKKSILML